MSNNNLTDEQIVIDVHQVSKRYDLYATPQDRLKQLVLPPLRRAFNRVRRKKKTDTHYARPFWALRDISFQVHAGETMGIIGVNGSGKSTLLQLIAGTLTPTSGEIKTSHRIAALLELGSGFNPDFTGKENIFLNGYILGLTQQQIEDRYEQIVAFAEIGEFIDQPVKTYSSGMFVRLAFAVQAHVDASIIIIDEALAVGDIFFRQKCYARLEALKQAGAAILIVSHGMSDIEQYCDRAILLEAGQVRFIGSATEATKHYYLSNQSDRVEENIVLSQSEFQEVQVNIQQDKWDQKTGWIDASSLVQVHNGMAKCTRYAIFDGFGNPRHRFAQGETAVFCHEFLTLKPISVPLGGIVLRNDRGTIVHGKGSLEYGVNVPEYHPIGTLVRCEQHIELKLQTGEYSFEMGLASMDANSYHQRSHLNHEELYAQVTRICLLPTVGVFSVGMKTGLRQGSQLTHHGIADLPGQFVFSFIKHQSPPLMMGDGQ
ncbi:MAG: ABC transporter ATP-binding protein [Gammaproteobacteria bacterium]|nr:ABC transporter ATP-binding protein [Gammaproteobacteria bacterium]